MNAQHISNYVGKLVTVNLLPTIEDTDTEVTGTLAEVTDWGVFILNQNTNGQAASQDFRGRLYTWQSIYYIDMSSAMTSQAAA